MAADLTQDSVLRFLLGRGGRARNAELLTHFARFLRDEDAAARARNREFFKRLVNSVATVVRADGGTYVVLKKRYRPPSGTGDEHENIPGLTPTVLPAAGILNLHKHVDTVRPQGPVPLANRGTAGDPWSSAVFKQSSRGTPRDQWSNGGIPGDPWTTTESKWSSRGAPTDPWSTAESKQCSKGTPTDQWSNGVTPGDLCSTPEYTWSSGGTPRNPSSTPESMQFSGGIPRDASCTSESKQSHGGTPKDLSSPPDSKRSSGGTPKEHFFTPESMRSSKSGWTSAESTCPTQDARMGELREVEVDECILSSCPSAEMEVKPELQERPSLHEPHEPWPFSIPLGQSQGFASSPCLADLPSQQQCRQGGLSRSNDSFLASHGKGHIPGISIEDYGPASTPPTHQRLQNTDNLEFQSLSSNQNSLLPSSADSNWPRVLSASDDVLNYRGIPEGDRNAFHEAKLHLHGERGVTPWHHSTGHLVDDDPQGSFPSPSLRDSSPEDGAYRGPMARRLSHRLRSRMCLSLGSDLDRGFREDSDASRLRRLHRISSFLSINCSVSSSRTHSIPDGLSSASSTHSLAHDCSVRQSQVPLDSREHEWFLKAASGSWGDIYSLFRDNPSLLNRRDFVSGYSVLHWIAKHGDHRVLNTLWYGVNKTGMTMDVDMKSMCGYTPLHLAAMHGHKNLLRLLVHKFKANVALRDNSGKRPWQYLEKSDNRELMELLGAPVRAPRGGVGTNWSGDKPAVLPAAPSGATVKRHSSLAALFKHKSQLRLSANAETFL